jgi:hypothetical protein
MCVWRERTSIEIIRFERRGLAIDTRSAEFFARPTEKKQTGPATRIFITFSRALKVGEIAQDFPT